MQGISRYKASRKIWNGGGSNDTITIAFIAGTVKGELCFEAHGWFDLVRTGRLIEVNQAAGKTNVSETHLLYPIPQSALDLNTALTQNPGYN